MFQIFFILAKYGFREIASYRLGTFRFKVKSTKKRVTTPQLIRETIEELGPTYVKFGQILADRSDLVSGSFRTELKKLQSRVKVFDRDIALSIIERSLGDSIDNIFENFNTTPIAAASIGQVYSAKIKGGDEVVVKVQRPFIEKKIKMDIFWLKVLAKQLANGYPELAAINIVGLIDEFAMNILREIDYNIESSNMKIFYDMFENSESIVIPKVYDDYTTRNVIVIERIVGMTPSSKIAVEAAGYNSEMIVANGADAIFQMIFKYGVFHADPHPGNLFVMKGSKLAFIDFGMVGMLRPREINFLSDFIIAYYKRDGNALTKILLELCNIRFFEQYEDLNFAINQVVMRSSSSETMKIQHFSGIMRSSIDVLVRFNLQIPTGIFMLMKTVATVEKFAENLAPSLDLTSHVLPYAKELAVKRAKENNIFRNMGRTLNDYALLFQTLPNDISQILLKLKEGKIQHEIGLTDDAMLVRTARQVSLRLAYAVVLIGLYIGAILLVSLNPEHKLGTFILYLTSTLILFLLLKWLFTGRRF